jgi:hypothetical protein
MSSASSGNIFDSKDPKIRYESLLTQLLVVVSFV